MKDEPVSSKKYGASEADLAYLNGLVGELPKIERVAIAQEVCIYELFRRIERDFSNCFLLESLGPEGRDNRYSVLGFSPQKILSAPRKDLLRIEDPSTGRVRDIATSNPYYLLKHVVPEAVSARDISAGLFGYIGYESAIFFNPTLTLKKSDEFEYFKFGLFLDGIIYDKLTGETIYFHQCPSRLDEIVAYLKLPKIEDRDVHVSYLGSTVSREDHALTVETVKKYIRDGRVFQCEVGCRSNYKISGDTVKIYGKLRTVNPSPHMYFMKFGEQKIIGASPELLFRLQGSEMETFPLAGTVGRGKDDHEDLSLSRGLLGDAKEIAEHSMLVDLHRNDLGRVAQFGTVRIRRLMDIKRFSHVQHISSEIVGLLAPGQDMFSALASNFPAGTLTGAPKLEAMTIIDEIEAIGRGPYGGALGQFLFTGDCTFAIPIRSIFVSGEDGYVQTCGGNVLDSLPDAEFEEIERKLSAMRVVLSEFEAIQC
jgi:anthranilate synthase component I